MLTLLWCILLTASAKTIEVKASLWNGSQAMGNWEKWVKIDASSFANADTLPLPRRRMSSIRHSNMPRPTIGTISTWTSSRIFRNKHNIGSLLGVSSIH